MHKRRRSICLIALSAVLAVANVGWTQSTIKGTLQLEEATPSLIHVKRIRYPALQLGTWQEEILVDEAGVFHWNAPGEGLYELVAPPWSWMVWVRPEEPSALQLSGGSSTARRLLGSPGQSSWSGEHPTQWMDSLVGLQRRANRLRAEALVLRSSGIAIQQRDSLAQLNAALAAAFESEWTQAVNGCTSEWECDLAWQIKLNEAAGSGQSQFVLDSLWTKSSMGAPNRTWASRLASPGAYSGWLAVHGGWWLKSQVDWEKMNEAVFTANMDSLASAMGGRWKSVDRSEMAAAWLDKAMDQPDALVRSVWETFPFPEPFVAAYDALREYRKIGRSGYAVGDLSWTLPNGDLSSIAEQCQQPWTVILALKNGSGIAAREREVFSQVAENLDRRDVCWVVLSLDENEANWRQTLSGRRTLDETVGWVGNNPRVMESLGLAVVPQVIVLDEHGKIAGRNMPLPSEGLQRRLQSVLPRE
jgi:hypothetical protein